MARRVTLEAVAEPPRVRPQGLKPRMVSRLSARLKSCPSRLAVVQWLVVLCAMLAMSVTARAQKPEKEERAIRAVATHWQNDWNHRNFKALAGLLSVDGDYVTAQGDWLEGRAAVESFFASRPASATPAEQWTNNQVLIRFLQPEIAIVHIRWAIESVAGGKGGSAGVSTWLMVKLGDGWKIRLAQDTAAAP